MALGQENKINKPRVTKVHSRFSSQGRHLTLRTLKAARIAPQVSHMARYYRRFVAHRFPPPTLPLYSRGTDRHIPAAAGHADVRDCANMRSGLVFANRTHARRRSGLHAVRPWCVCIAVADWRETEPLHSPHTSFLLFAFRNCFFNVKCAVMHGLRTEHVSGPSGPAAVQGGNCVPTH